MSSVMHDDLVEWTSEQCDVQKFVEKYGRYVPLLVRIADGYAGRDESMHLFAQNEVYWVYDILKQQRLIATDRDENYISIPLDYKQRFHIIDKHQKSSAKPLRDIIDRVKLRDVDFMVEGNNQVSFSLGADIGDQKELGPLRFDQLYELKYLLACPIVDNCLQPKLSAIPSYVPVTLDVARGFKYGTEADFQKFGKELQSAIQRFEKMPLKLCNDILLSSEAPESDYEYVNPVHIVLIDDDKDELVSIPSASPSPSSSPPSTWSPLPDNNAVDSSRFSRPKQAANAYYVPPRSPQGVASPALSRVKAKPILLPPIPTATVAPSSVRCHGPPVPPRKQACNELRKRLQRDGVIECVILPTTEDSNDEEAKSEPSTAHPHDEQDRHSRSYRRWRPTNYRRANSVDSLANWPTGTSSLSESESENTIPPTRSSKVLPAPRKPDRNKLSIASKFRGDVGLVPTNIASLSVEEVGECLEMLHLSEYVERFNRMDVDGQLLVSLNIQVLTSDFNFTTFEAIKLMKFAVEGWRPLKRSGSPG